MIRRDKARDGNLYRHCRFSMKHVNHWLKRKGITRPDNRKGIDQRPPEADGKRFGDWEADTIVGPKRSGALTLIERSTNKIIIRKLPPNYKATHVRQAIIEALLPYKTHVLTITTDNGSELACYQDIERTRMSGLLCKTVCTLAERGRGKRKYTHQTIYNKEIQYQSNVSTIYNSCSEEN